MTVRDREGLITRIRQMRRVGAVTPARGSSEVPVDHDAPQLDALEARVAHLEHMLQGLQDSVHRESERHGRVLAELQAKIEPGAMGAALDRDARDRGL